jgi:hypothetical protein
MRRFLLCSLSLSGCPEAALRVPMFHVMRILILPKRVPRVWECLDAALWVPRFLRKLSEGLEVFSSENIWDDSFPLCFGCFPAGECSRTALCRHSYRLEIYRSKILLHVVACCFSIIECRILIEGPNCFGTNTCCTGLHLLPASLHRCISQ